MSRYMVAAFLILVAGCGSGGPDPRTLIPVDSDAWMAVRPAREIAGRVGPVVEQYPEFGGAVDLVRSVVGIDYASVDGESGLDPRRGSVAAYWRGGLLIILPVSDARLAMRRIALRLARFGFEPARGVDSMMNFESRRRGHACAVANAGVAAVFAGPAESCALLPGVAAEADDSRESVVRRTVEAVSDELGMPDADIILKISNQIFAPQLLSMAGLPEKSPASYVASGMIGDLRAVFRLDRTVIARAAIGAEGDRFVAEPVVDSVSEMADAVRVDVTVGPSVRPMLDSVVPLCGRRCSSRGIDMMIASWDGRLQLRVPSASDGRRPRAGKAMLDILLAVTDRVTITGVAGMRRSGQGIVDIVRKRLGQPADPTAPDSGLAFRFEGHYVTVAAGGERLAVASGPGALDAVRGFTVGVDGADLPAWPEVPRLASIRINPEGLLNVSGFGFLEYLQRLVNPLRQASADIYFEQGRLAVDGRVFIR